jgi:hypothetical protein
MPALTRRRDPDASQETWLIHYDDIRVGSIAMQTHHPLNGARIIIAFAMR